MNKIDLKFMKKIFKDALELNDYNLELTSSYEQVPGWDPSYEIISQIEEQLKLEFEIDEIIELIQ